MTDAYQAVPAAPVSLRGWGRTSPSAARVVRPGSEDEVAHHLGATRCGVGQDAGRGVLARGLGRSYGDVAQNAGGLVLDMTGLGRVLDVNLSEATVEVESGVSLDRLLRMLTPLGLSLPVQPGTRQVTVGGALACDVHGKNHHRVGSFGSHVLSLRLATPDGRVQDLGPDGPDPELFWGTIGGLGLTGVVLRARLQLRRVETSSVLVRAERHPDLPSLMDALRERDRTWEYTVAWFDSVARGRRAGRGVLLSGRDAVLDELPRERRDDPLHLPRRGTLGVPPVPFSLVNRASGRVFNEAWFGKAPRRPATGLQHSFGFFQPLDGLARWYHLYGPRGMAQYQLLVPDDAASMIPKLVRAIADSGHVSCLNVLKRFGPGNRALMSFPEPGWTLAVDLPVRAGLGALLDRLDDMVREADGRLYLAKDSRVPAAHLRAMYPEAESFGRLLARVDPEGVLASDLARRLKITTRGSSHD